MGGGRRLGVAFIAPGGHLPARVSEISTFPALSSSLPQLLPRLSAVALCNVLPTNWQSTPGARVGAWLSGKGTLYPCRRAASSKRPCTSTLHPTLAPAPLPHRTCCSSLNCSEEHQADTGRGKKEREAAPSRGDLLLRSPDLHRQPQPSPFRGPHDTSLSLCPPSSFSH